MRIFSKPVNQAFVVDIDKAEEFINHKNPNALNKQIEEAVIKFTDSLNIKIN